MALLFKFSIVVVSIFLLSSCNEDIVDKKEFGSPAGTPNGLHAKTYRVAYIVIDGAIGSVVGSEATDYNNMPFLASLTSKSLFTWNSIVSNETNDIAYYADLLTGVKSAKHKVLDNSMVGTNLSNYPLVFDRLKSKLNIRTALISSNSDLGLLSQNSTIDNKQLLSTDEEVIAAAKSEVIRDDSFFTFITLNNVDKVGKLSGYGPGNPAYIAALKKVDDQLKELVGTIESREKYNSEKWLIVITSNRGGDYVLSPNLNDGSLYSIPKRNSFVVLYNNQFKYKIVQKLDLSDPTYDGSAIRFSGSATTASIDAAQAAIYNIGNSATEEFTIQLKFKKHAIATNNPVIISKVNNTGNSEDGWSFIYDGNNGWRLKVKGKNIPDGSGEFVLNNWYTLTAKIYNDNGTRRVKLFRNGELKAENTLAASDLGTSTQSLKLGYGAAYGSGASHTITDVRIYNTALPDSYIAANYCSTAVYDTDVFWNNLIGYWPAIEGAGNVILDKSNSGRNFSVSGAIAWNSFSERSGSICPTAPQYLEASTISPLDAPLFIYNWLGVLGTNNFNLDSEVWAPNYSSN